MRSSAVPARLPIHKILSTACVTCGDELERLGYDIIIFASDVQRAAIFGMRRLLQELREKRPGAFFPDTVGFQEREGIINSDYYFQLQERYLRLD